MDGGNRPVARHGSRESKRLARWDVQLCYRYDDPQANVSRIQRGLGALSAVHSNVVLADTPHHADQHRDEHQNHPGTEHELRYGDLNCYDAGGYCAKRIDRCAQAPAAVLIPQLIPVLDQAGLTEREGDEDADGVEGYQAGDAATV